MKNNSSKSNDIDFNRSCDINRLSAKSCNVNNQTVYVFEKTKLIRQKIQITESFIRKVIFVIGVLVGILLKPILGLVIDLVSKVKFNNFFPLLDKLYTDFSLCFHIFIPFSKDIFNNSKFQYVFKFSTILSLLAILFFLSFLFWGINNYYSVSENIIFTFLFVFIYVNTNFWICHLIIKITVWFKILSFLAIIISNILFVTILMIIASEFFDWYT